MSPLSLCHFSNMSQGIIALSSHTLSHFPSAVCFSLLICFVTDALTVWLFWGMMRYFSQAAKPFFPLPVNVAESHLPLTAFSVCFCLSLSNSTITLSFSYPLVWITSSAHPSFGFALTVSLSLIHSVSFCLSLPLFCSCLAFLWGPNPSIGLHLCPRQGGIPSFTSSVSLHYLNPPAVFQLSYLSLKQVPFSFFFLRWQFLIWPFTSRLPLLSIFLCLFCSSLPLSSPTRRWTLPK